MSYILKVQQDVEVIDSFHVILMKAKRPVCIPLAKSKSKFVAFDILFECYNDVSPFK